MYLGSKGPWRTRFSNVSELAPLNVFICELSPFRPASGLMSLDLCWPQRDIEARLANIHILSGADFEARDEGVLMVLQNPKRI